MRPATIHHLASRFAGSLDPRPIGVGDECWVQEHLLPGERELWAALSNPDRRHAVGVARGVVARLGADTDRSVVAAALLHDIGKVVSGLGTFRRVGATLTWSVIDSRRASEWASREDTMVRRRLGQYRLHPELGAQMLAAAGSAPLTVAWAAEHHAPPDSWTIPLGIGLVLKACDDD